MSCFFSFIVQIKKDGIGNYILVQS